MTRVLRVEGLSVRRDGVDVLDDVHWEVEAGEHWALMGANGSGKTSLLQVLTAYLSPTRGTVELLGERYGRTDWRELRKRVGVVTTAIPSLMPASEPGLGVVASGREARIGSLGPLTGIERTKAHELLERAGCAELADRPWRVLSQGERQRLLIGRALMAEPSLLVLDEPCAGLDPVARERFLEFLQDLVSEAAVDAPGSGGTPTLVLVTHHVEEIVPALSHVLLLSRGRVSASGPKETVLTSAALSEAFGASVRVRREGDRFAVDVESARGAVL